MEQEIRAAVEALVPELIALRHRIHEEPELSGHEEQTAALVAERLRVLGLAPRTGVGGHGVVAEIQGARPGPTIALRADMDALPIEEAGSLPYRSRRQGVMHACGHDGHTTMLVGAAQVLAGLRESLPGRVRLLFQPAEETVNGAMRMCDAGAMEGVDAIVALHGWPGVPLGTVGIREGAMMASADTFDLVVRGQGGHAAYPHRCVDPILVGAQIVQALQSIASREVDPSDPVVVSVTRFEAGTAHNVIPETARLAGTFRTLNARTREEMPARIERIAGQIAAAHRAACEAVFTRGAPPVLNDPGMTARIARVAAEVVGPEGVAQVPHSSMGAEDFAFYLEHAPGAMFRLGLGDCPAIHTPSFDFDDRALAVGVELFARIALDYLRLNREH